MNGFVHSREKEKTGQQYLFPFIVLGLFFLLGCSSSRNAYTPDHKFSPQQLQQDASVLWQTFQQCHPSLYWYTSKDSVDNAFNHLISSLTDSLTELQFRTRVAETVALIRCGHTSVRSSKAAARYRDKSKKPFFPLQVKVWNGDSMVVLANAHRQDSNLVRGVIINRINDKTAKELIDTFSHFISADGLHNNLKYQLISSGFPVWYKAIIGLSTEYTIDITTLNGQPKTVIIKNFDPVLEDSLKEHSIAKSKPVTPDPSSLPKAPKPSKISADRKLTIDTARSLAIMELNTFSHARLPQFFRQTFRTMQKNNIQNLAIELRGNGGGNIMNSTRLTKYIVDHPFKVADTVAAQSFKYPYPHLVKNGFFYKMQSWFVTGRQSDDRLHYRIYERKYFKPKSNNHFNGQVFILTGGFTFSASTLFINPIKGQKNVTIIGEETGGGAYGNTAVNIPDLRLPNTGVRVRLPLYRLVVNKNLPHDGSGIMPDIMVPPTSWYLAHRIDPKMEKVYELITKALQKQ